MRGLIAAAVLATVATPAFAQTQTASPPPAPAAGSDPVGGYAPPPQPPAGPNSVFVQAPPPDVAFPPPPPLPSYPFCKKGQTDHCMQRGDPK